MLKFLFLLGVIALARVSASPNGKDYLASLTPEQIRATPNDIIEDALLDVPDLIRKYGYPVEEHEIETEDGYLITMHRIPGQQVNRDGVGQGKPVMLMHGLLGSSADWIVNRPGKALGYELADKGYDVWMGNARGNYYSRKHVSIDPDDGTGKYWKFSWHEIGFYDLPACVDHILATNGNEKMFYVAHSQGTAIFYVMASTKPEYNEKISLMQALAPVAYTSHIKSKFIQFVAPYSPTLEILSPMLGMYETLPQSRMTKLLAQYVCNEDSKYLPLCTNFIWVLGGEDVDQLNTTMLPIYICHTPAGASNRQQFHFSQNYLSGKFRQYDHGLAQNLIIYGQATPPDYDLSKVTAPVALHYGKNDLLAVEEDVDILYSELPNPIGEFAVPFGKFNHLDFIWAMDANRILYDFVDTLMQRY